MPPLTVSHVSETAMAEFVIMFPNNSTACQLGKRITCELGNLTFYIPGDIHEQAAQTCFEEVKIECANMTVNVNKISNVRTMESYDYVIFPNLYVNHTKPYSTFSRLCKNLFRYICYRQNPNIT